MNFGVLMRTTRVFSFRRLRRLPAWCCAGVFSLCLATVGGSTAIGAAATALPTSPVRSSKYFRITVVDQNTGRGVPCVCLRTVDHVEYWTDSAGEVAFYEQELMGRTVFFYVQTYGYTFRTNGFGFAGVQLAAKPGGHEVLKVRRDNIAERIYRCTGEGIYRDSELLGLRAPAVCEDGKEPVVGQDGGLMLPFRGKFMWSWGDTSLAHFPLGVFKSTGATSEFAENGGLDPDVGVRYHYFRDANGRVRGMVELDEKIVWPMAPRLAVDKEGKEHLLMNYCIGYDPKGGIVEFDEQSGYFRHVADLRPGSPYPYLCSTVLNYRQHGHEYFCYGPWGSVRSGTDLASNLDPRSWEAFTCLRPGTTAKDAPAAFDLRRQRAASLGVANQCRYSHRYRAVPTRARGQAAPGGTLVPPH